MEIILMVLITVILTAGFAGAVVLITLIPALIAKALEPKAKTENDKKTERFSFDPLI